MSQLRGTPAAVLPEGQPNRIPAPGDPAFTVDSNRAFGIRFYPARGGFFLPYALLQSVNWTTESLSLNFTTDTVTIVGSRLHGLFVEIAEHRVNRIHAEPAWASEGNAAEVTEIIRLPRG